MNDNGNNSAPSLTRQVVVGVLVGLLVSLIVKEVK